MTNVLDLLHRHGWNATSFQAVETDFRHWFDAENDAVVAYIDTGGAWVVAGSPIASVDRVGIVAQRFVEAARSRQKRVAFFAVEPRFLDACTMPSMPIGEQPWWDPRQWNDRHRGHRSFKEQLRRARAKGVCVERVEPRVAAGAMRPELERLIACWLRSRVMPAMSFLVALEPFVVAEERRYYVARLPTGTTGEIIGLLVAVPVYDRNGWFFEDILRSPAAPNGTAELMIDAAMREAGEDGCSFVTLGLAPLAGDDPMLRTTRSLMRGFYNFEGLHAFKSKLRPDGWTSIHLAWPEGRTAPGALFDALDAFAGGHMFIFAIKAIFRGPAPVLAALGIALIPWTITMTRADTKRWFPSRRIQLAWCVFDLAMSATLLSLSRKWRRPVAIAAGAAAAADGVLTTIQATTYNARRAGGIRDILVIAAAVAAPFAAAAILLTPVLLQLRGKSGSGTESHGIESRDRISARHREGGHRRGAHDGLRQAEVLGSGRGRGDARGAEPAQDARHGRDRRG